MSDSGSIPDASTKSACGRLSPLAAQAQAASILDGGDQVLTARGCEGGNAGGRLPGIDLSGSLLLCWERRKQRTTTFANDSEFRLALAA